MTSPNFLQSVVAWFTAAAGDRPSLEDVTFVMPNKRSALFLKKYIRDTFTAPSLMPRIMTAPTFVSTWSEYPAADRTELLFVLFNAYRNVLNSRGSATDAVRFDDFIYWGDMMLNDFDDVDRSLAEASQVFKNIKDLKDIQADFLDEEQKDIVRRVWGENRLTAHIERFWLHTDGVDGPTPLRDKFVYLWELLAEIYDEYRRLLRQLNRSSAGMQYRSAVAAVRDADVRDFTGRTRYAFVGFSDLTAAETVIFDHLRRQGVAYFFWDTAPLGLFGSDDHLPVALRRLSRLARKFPAPEDYAVPIPTVLPAVDTISVPSNVAQAKYAGILLRELIDKKLLDPDNAVNTAVILPDESLLLPLLSSIPPEIKALNISMGLPYRSTAFAILLHSVISMHRRSRLIKEQVNYFHEDITDVLSHPHVRVIAPEAAEKLTKMIRSRRMYNIPAQVLTDEAPELAPLFASVSDTEDVEMVARYLDHLLQWLGAMISRHLIEINNGDDSAVEANFDIKAIRYFRDQLSVLSGYIKTYDIAMSDSSFFHLFERLFGATGLRLSGTPLRGLQILGVLESRALDFDNVIVLSMNEGVFPRSRYSRTMIPAALRNGYGLPDFDSAEWTYAYSYYRLLSRARRVTLLYDSRVAGVGQGEASRYLTQTLHLLPALRGTQSALMMYTSAAKDESFTIAKTGAVMEALNEFRAGGRLRFSATALKAYLACPFRFYLQYVRSMRSEDEIVDNLTSAEYGNVLHRVVQELYASSKGEEIDGAKIMRWHDSDLMPLILDALNKEHFHGRLDAAVEEHPAEGRVAAKTIEVIVKANLLGEAAAYGHRPFRWVGNEVEIGPRERGPYVWKITDDLSVNFYMSIDRVDRLDEHTLRFIDFKSGSDSTSGSFARMFAGEHEVGGIFQLLLYSAAWRAMVDPEAEIEPRLHAMRTLSASLPLVPMTVTDAGTEIAKNGKQKSVPVVVERYSQVAQEFEPRLAALFTEIFDPTVPFRQCNDEKRCRFCPFIQLCGRRVVDY